MPAVAQALALLDIKISEAHLRGTGLIRVIHGWGSTGTGGRIKAALPQHLNDLKQRKIILDYLPGSQYSDTIPRGRHLLSKFPDLKTTIRPDRRNPGITLIEL
ncbi:MAG: Smr/MutS family protein [Balneolales bacterium]